MTPSVYTLAATGWLELGSPADAWEALESLSPADRCRPEVFSLRVQILLAMNRAEDAAVIAAGVVRMQPLNVEARHQLARALYRMGRVNDARDHVLECLRQRPTWAATLRKCPDLQDI